MTEVLKICMIAAMAIATIKGIIKDIRNMI